MGVNDDLGGNLTRFDEAWRAGEPRLADYLPPEGSPGRLKALVGLARIDLERRLARGEDARVERLYLEPYPELVGEREAVLGLAAREWELRRRKDAGASLEEFLSRFGEYREELGKRLRSKPLLETEKTPPAPAPVGGPPPSVPGCELLGRLGGGGMGVVYRGRDPDLRRDLAVKVMRPECQGIEDLQTRFVAEAQIGGQLQHPNVLPVYRLGVTADGLPYFTMKLMKGRSLAELLRDRRSAQDVDRYLSVFEGVCQAIAYAHDHRVIHRDLKPENVMVGDFGEVQVIDWGLARKLSAEGEEHRAEGKPGTEIETIRTDDKNATPQTGRAGTPAYAPPEQMAGAAWLVDERADVFGLGAILCEILTGQPPYVGERVRDLAQRGDTAEAFGRLDGCGAEPALVALCKECLARDVERRPRNAKEVARRVATHFAEVQQGLRRAEMEKAAAEARAQEELKRAEERAEAQRREALLQRQKRGRTVVLSAAVVLASLVGTVVSVLFAKDADAQKRAAQGKEGEAREAENKELNAKLDEHRGAYVSAIGSAVSEYENGRTVRARELLARFQPRDGEPDVRDFEWYYLWRLVAGETLKRVRHGEGRVKAVRFSPDGSKLYSAASDEAIKVWDVATLKPRGSVTLERPGGIGIGFRESPGALEILAVGNWGSARGRLGKGDRITAIGEADGRMVPLKGLELRKAAAMLGGPIGSEVRLEVVQKAEKKPVVVTLVRQMPAEARAFSPDASLLATLSPLGIDLWDTASGKPRGGANFPEFEEIPQTATIAFSSDGRFVTHGSSSLRSRVLLERGVKGLVQFPGTPVMGAGGADFGPAESRSLFGWFGDSPAEWSLDAPGFPKRTGELFQRSARMLVVVSPDGRFMAGADSTAGEIDLIDAKTLELRAVLKGHRQGVQTLAFSPDSNYLASGGADGLVRIWSTRLASEVIALSGLDGMVDSVAFHPSGQMVAAGGYQGEVAVWNLSRRADYDLLLREPEGFASVAFTPEGKTVIAGSSFGKVGLHSCPTLDGRLADQFQGIQPFLGYLTSARNHDTVAAVYLSAPFGHQVVTFDAKTWAKTGAVRIPDFPLVTCAALSADGKLLAVGASSYLTQRDFIPDNQTPVRGHRVFVYRKDESGWSRVAALSTLSERLLNIAFTRDGTKLLTVEEKSSSCAEWDWVSGKILRRYACPEGNIYTLAISPDDGAVAVASGNWNMFSGPMPSHIYLFDRRQPNREPRVVLPGHQDVLIWLAFSPDNSKLASAGADGFVRVWDASAGGKENRLLHSLPHLHPTDIVAQAARCMMPPVGFGALERLVALPTTSAIWAEFTADGSSLVTAWMDNFRDTENAKTAGIVEWDLKSGREFNRVTTTDHIGLTAPLTQDGTVVSLDVKSSKLHRWVGKQRVWEAIPGHPHEIVAPHEELISAAQVSPDGRTLVTGDRKGQIVSWNLANRKVLRAWPAHKGEVTQFAFVRDTETLASVSFLDEHQAEVRRWHARTGEQHGTFALPRLKRGVGRLQPHSVIGFFADGKTLAVLGADGGSIEFWDVLQGARKGEPIRLKGAVLALAVSNDGRQLAIAIAGFEDDDPKRSRQYRVIVWELPERRQLQSWPLLTAPPENRDRLGNEYVTALAFCPRSRAIAVGNARGAIEFWHVHNRRLMLSLSAPEGGAVTTLLFSPDGRTLAVGGLREVGSLTLYHAAP